MSVSVCACIQSPPMTISAKHCANQSPGGHKDNHFSRMKCLLSSTDDKRPRVKSISEPHSCLLCTFPWLELDCSLCFPLCQQNCTNLRILNPCKRGHWFDPYVLQTQQPKASKCPPTIHDWLIKLTLISHSLNCLP